jgi:hypothetical protein
MLQRIVIVIIIIIIIVVYVTVTSTASTIYLRMVSFFVNKNKVIGVPWFPGLKLKTVLNWDLY